MQIRILIIGSTGKLGVRLLDFCKKNNIKIDAITCNQNTSLLKKQKAKYKVNNIFKFNNFETNSSLNKYIYKYSLKIVYFLDHGSGSLTLLSHILKHQHNTIIAIANKEMIIAGNLYMLNQIKKSKNIFMPLDSEHFSLLNSKLDTNNIDKIYITASGGPFYKNKSINLNQVTKQKVLSHPKWQMGYNNLIDSSNFINKILEIYELAVIYNIDMTKIDFLVSPEAYIHSIIKYKDNVITLNCFNNEMLITLTKPLSLFFEFKLKLKESYMFKHINYYFEKFNDKRFKILKHFNNLKKLDHPNQIKFMLLNNFAQKLYLKEELNYNQIVNFIMKNLNTKTRKVKLRSFKDISNYIEILKNEIQH